jgi:Skp family chaperone for outer membrane proteins
MTKLLKPFAAAALLLAGASPLAVSAAPAPAAAVGVNGIAVADFRAIVGNSAAYKYGQAQIASTYAAQFNAAKARQSQLEAQLQPLVAKFNKDRAANVGPAVLQQEAQTIQQIQESGKTELEGMVQPARLADAYVMEQISDKMDAAISTAMKKNGVTLLLNPQAVQAASNAYNLNPAILAELDAVLPSVAVQPPAGWQPREVRDAQAQAAQAGARGTAGSSDGR